MDNSEIVFTPSSILDLLSSIDELKDYDIGLTESIDGNLQLQIGDSVYDLSTEYAEDVRVDEQAVDEISQINEETYDEIADDTLESEPVEGGLVKEMLKTLALGGMVRLGKGYATSKNI